MATRAKAKTSAKSSSKSNAKAAATTTKSSGLTKTTLVSFRTKIVLKKKAESVFEDLGISTSAAINMFLAQVVRDKGMPFMPSAQRKNDQGMTNASKSAGSLGAASGDDTSGYIALEELWNEL